MSNLDENVVDGFGKEWASVDNSALSPHELRGMFETYFELFPWDALSRDAVGFDLGCGSGRWASLWRLELGNCSALMRARRQ
jgi:hypothetical protein